MNRKIKRKAIGSTLIIIISLTFGCRNENGNNIEVLKEDALNKNSFKLSLYVKVEKKDFFDFFYAFDSLNEKFTENRKIRYKLNAGNIDEVVTFELYDKCPLKFRIDLGRNLNQKLIVIYRVDINCGGKRIIIPGNISEHFFIANRYLEFSKNGDTLNIIRKGETKTPFITSSALLNKRMKIEFR